MQQSFDVFISYHKSSTEKTAVEQLNKHLKSRNLRVWIDTEQCRPGKSFIREMENGVRESKSGIALIGSSGIGPWHTEEIEALLHHAVQIGKPIIPVLLPTADDKINLPIFLSNRTWVDFRCGFVNHEIDRLVWGITGTSQSTPPPSAASIEQYIAQRGHLIQKIKAKDSTGRQAYYFILIQPDVEEAFFAALNSSISIKLDDYGIVIASCYGEEPTGQLKQLLFDKYGFRI